MTSIVPRGIRNCNPGNLRFPAGSKVPGIVGRDKDGFTIFQSMQDGLDALAWQLERYYTKRKLRTISDIIRRYSPDGHELSYIQFLCRYMVAEPDCPLPFESPDVLARLVRGVAKFENGADYFTHQQCERAVKKAKGIIDEGVQNSSV